MKKLKLTRQIWSVVALVILLLVFCIANIYLDYAITRDVILVGLLLLQVLIFFIYDRKKTASVPKADIYMTSFLIVYSIGVVIYILLLPAGWRFKIVSALYYALLIIGGLVTKLKEQLKKRREE